MIYNLTFLGKLLHLAVTFFKSFYNHRFSCATG